MLCAQNLELAKPYMEILDMRWDKHLNLELIIFAYYLNTTIIYFSNYEGLSRPVQFTALDYLENKAICADVDKMVKEREIFQSLSKSFGRPSARAAAKNQNPWSIMEGSKLVVQLIMNQLMGQICGCMKQLPILILIRLRKLYREEMIIPALTLDLE